MSSRRKDDGDADADYDDHEDDEDDDDNYNNDNDDDNELVLKNIPKTLLFFRLLFIFPHIYHPSPPPFHPALLSFKSCPSANSLNAPPCLPWHHLFPGGNSTFCL